MRWGKRVYRTFREDWASCTCSIGCRPCPGAHIEFKGYERIPIECSSSSLRLENDAIKVPT